MISLRVLPSLLILPILHSPPHNAACGVRSSEVCGATSAGSGAAVEAAGADAVLVGQVARDFAGEEAFYYPHNLDFRGRAYPMHPHLNHLGNDMCRGLLQFAEARPLGRSGLGWLYVQVSCAGSLLCKEHAKLGRGIPTPSVAASS